MTSARILIIARGRTVACWKTEGGCRSAKNYMTDLIYVAVMIGIFAVAALYAWFCEKI